MPPVEKKPEPKRPKRLSDDPLAMINGDTHACNLFLFLRALLSTYTIAYPISFVIAPPPSPPKATDDPLSSFSFGGGEGSSSNKESKSEQKQSSAIAKRTAANSGFEPWQFKKERILAKLVDN